MQIMPRVARLDIPGVVQHVIVRGIEKKAIFLDDGDRQRFLDRLSQVLMDTETLCYAWSLIPNHVHLLLNPVRFKLAVPMKRLLTGYAVTFNLIHRRSGHLFQNRYKSIVCDRDEYLLELVRYIHLNPVRAGLVKTLEELDHYPWTGHSVLMGYRKWEGQETEEILGLFSGGRSGWRGRKAYRQYVFEGLEMGHRENFSGAGKRGRPGEEGTDKDYRILGDREFAQRILRERALSEKGRALWSISDLLKKVSRILGTDAGDLRRPSKNRMLAQARGILCYAAVRELGYKGIDIGKELNLGSAGVSRALRRGEVALRKNPDLKKRILGI
jgi:putative transposase